jgi:uncharacterized protein YqeY
VTTPLKARLQQDLNEARRSRNKLATTVYSTTLAEVRNEEISLGAEATEEDVQRVVTRALKRRREAAEQMRAGGREELAEKEEAEADLLKVYLPPPLTEEEVRGMIQEIVAGGADQMGPVMGKIMPLVRGRFDGKEVNRLVREELAG